MTDRIPTGALAFLSTPYSDWGDLGLAHADACTIAGKLMLAGIHVFCPIAHSHHIARYGEIDRLDHKFCLAQNEVVLRKCDVLIVAQMQGCEISKGIAHEIDTFRRLGKPIFDVDPTTMTMAKRQREKPQRERCDDVPTDEIAKLTNEYLEGDGQ